jgi:hypothetical protein
MHPSLTTAPSAGLRGGRWMPPKPPPRTTTLQGHMAARRHRTLTALLLTPLAAPRPLPHHFLTSIHLSHSHTIINITPQTMHIDMQQRSIPAVYKPQTTQWPMHLTTPQLLLRKGTSSHPLDYAQSEGECHRRSIQPGPLDWDHIACTASACCARALALCLVQIQYIC